MAKYTGTYANETVEIATSAYGTEPAADVTLNLTYEATQSPSAQRQGYYEVTAATGTYTELNPNGTIEATYPITKLLNRGLIGGDNNRLYLNSAKVPTIVDRHGLSFEISDPTSTRPHRTQRLNFFHSTGHTKVKGYELYTNYHDRVVTSVTTSSQGSATSSTNALAENAVVCFASGTHLRTTRGEVVVEALAIGDVVVTASGALRPIRWLGHRTIDCARHPRPELVQPVRVAAHAFGAGLPERDLVVSPGHALCIDVMGEILVPAGALVDGEAVTRLDVERVTYWHVELETHDIVLAEGLPTESYLEMGNRGFFVESEAVALAATPDAGVRTHADFCRPFHSDGPLVVVVRSRLAARTIETELAGVTAKAA